MRSLILSLCTILVAWSFNGYVVAQDAANTKQREHYVSDASFIIGTYLPKSSDHSPESIAKTATIFLDSLDDKLRQRAAHKLDSPERRQWTNLPAPVNAGGVRLGDLNANQVKAACDMMAALFSKQGYDKMCHIMLADDQLLRNGRPRDGFGTENFSLVIFSTPSPTEPWAFQIDGHHVGVNIALQGEDLTMSPSFIGTQPEAFKIGDKEFRPFAGEVDDAFKLIASLSDEQRKQAIVSPKRGFIRTGPGKDNLVPEAQGVSCATYTKEQKQILMDLISQWVGDLPPTHAELRMKQLVSEIDKMRFAWHGPSAARSDVSYSIQGPSLIIEYACQNLGGNPLNHLHSIYRDPTNEYGKQLEKP